MLSGLKLLIKLKLLLLAGIVCNSLEFFMKVSSGVKFFAFELLFFLLIVG